MRIRTIKPEFWKHQRMAELPAETRLLAIGLLNYADDEGYFDAHPALIRGELMPYSEKTARIPKMLEELSGIGFLSVEEKEDGKLIGHVSNFLEHQRINRPTRSKHSRTPHARLTEDSVSVHDALTASSLPEGKGTGNRERKGVVSADADEPALTLESPEDPPPLPPAGSDVKKKKGGRERDAVFDALLRVCGMPMSGLTGSEGGRVAKARKEIMDAMPQDRPTLDMESFIVAEIERRAAAYRREWPNAELTPTALASNWSRFAGGQKKEGGGPTLLTIENAPEGFEEAMEALFGGEWREQCPAWPQMTGSDKSQVRDWLRANGKEAA